MSHPAIAQGAERAETVCENFSERAITFVWKCLLARGPMSSEKLTAACKEIGIIPHDDRAFGSVYQTLSRRGLIVKAGTCARERGHGTSGGIVWKLKEGK